MTNALYIDDVLYNVPVVDIKLDYSFLEKYANRTEDGDIKIETIGGYLNYTIKLGVINDPETFRKIFEQVTNPRERFHKVRIPGNTGFDDEFYGYFSSIKAEVEKMLDDGISYKDFTFKMTSKKPTRR